MIGYAWVLVALPLAAFVVLALLRNRLPGQGAWVSVLAMGAAFLLYLGILAEMFFTIAPGGSGPAALTYRVPWLSLGSFRFDLGMIVDPLSIVMLGVVASCSFLIQVYSLAYMRGDPRYGWFFAVLSLFTASMLGLVLASSFLVLYISWELVGLCSYLLIGFWYDRRSAAEASKKAFVTTRIGDVGLFIGILLILVTVGSFDYDRVFGAVAGGQIAGGLLTLIAILIFLGAMGKSGQVPLHVWLPDAMEGPTPVSALIHAATMVAAGVYLVARAYPLFHASPEALTVILIIGSITALLASFVALVQRDIKRIIAYSTVGELGLMMMALGVGGYTAGFFHLTTHAFFKALLFLGAGSVIHAVHDRQDIFEMGGLRRRMPVTFWTMILAAASLAGVPLLSGFWSKDEIGAATIAAGASLPFAIVVITAFLKAFFMFRLIFVVFFGAPRTDAAAHGYESPPLMLVPLIVLTVPATLLGLIGSPLLGGLFGRLVYFDHPHDPIIAVGPMVITTVASLAGIGLAVAMYLQGRPSPAALAARLAPITRLLDRKLYFDVAYQWLIDRVVLVFSSLVALIDRKVINDTGVDGPADLTGRAGEALRYHETGRVSNYLLVFSAGVAVLCVGIYLSRVLGA